MMLFILYAVFLCPTLGLIIDKPKTAYVFAGDNVTFACSTNNNRSDVIFWNRTRYGDSTRQIYWEDKHNIRKMLDITVKKNLPGYKHPINSEIHLTNIHMSNAGTYTCIDGRGQGDAQEAELIVLKNNVTCRAECYSNYIYANCSFQYRGNIKLNGEWFFINSFNKSVNVYKNKKETPNSLSATINCSNCKLYGVYFKLVSVQDNFSYPLIVIKYSTPMYSGANDDMPFANTVPVPFASTATVPFTTTVTKKLNNIITSNCATSNTNIILLCTLFFIM